MDCISCDLRGVLLAESNEKLFSVSCNDIMFVFEFKLWVKLLFGITESLDVLVNGKIINDLDSIDLLKENVVTFAFSEYPFQIQAATKRLWSTPIHGLPMVISAKLTLLKSRLPKDGIVQATESRSSFLTETKVVPYKDDRVADFSVGTVTNISNDKSIDEDSACNGESSMAEIEPDFSAKRKRVRRRGKKFKKSNDEEPKYEFSLPLVTPEINTPKPKNHIRFDFDDHLPVEGANGIDFVPDIRENRSSDVTGKNCDTANEKSLRPPMKRKNKPQKVFALGQFLNDIRRNGENFDGSVNTDSEKMEEDRIDSPKLERTLEPEQNFCGNPGEAVFNGIVDQPQKGFLTPASSTPTAEVNGLQHLLELRTVYGSPPVFLLKKTHEEPKLLSI